MKVFLRPLVVLIFVAGTTIVPTDTLFAGESVSKENRWQAFVAGEALESGASVKFGADSAVVRTCPLEEDSSLIQVFKFIDVEGNQSYKLTFEAESDKAGLLSVSYCLGKAPWTRYASEEINLEVGQKSYECTLEVQPGPDGEYETPRSLRFMFGAFEDATISISNLSFEPSS